MKNISKEQGDKYATDAEHLIYNGSFKLKEWDNASSDDWTYEKMIRIGMLKKLN